LAAFVLAAAGCTRNNGSIGAWFGAWQVVEIDVDGERLDDYAGNVTAMFQNNIIRTSAQYDHHEIYSWWATWSVQGNTLVIDGKGKSIAPDLMLPADCVVELEILRRPGSVMEWQYVDHDGRVIEYKLKKVY
jgi:hypothetical protein